MNGCQRRITLPNYSKKSVTLKIKDMKAYAVANIEVRGRMADKALFTRESSVGNWKSGVAKKYDFC